MAGSGNSLMQAAIAEVQVAQLVALRNPRDEMVCRDAILRACKRESFAKSGIFSKPVGGKKIEGLSIRFVEEALRCWGNCKTQVFVVEDTDERITWKIVVWDLQTGLSHSEDVTVRRRVERKNTAGRNIVGDKDGRLNSYGDRVWMVEATDDEVQQIGRAQASKALRNLARRIIPSDLREEAEATMRATLRGAIKRDPVEAAKEVADGFAQIGVRPQMLAEYLKHDLASCSPSEIEDLRGLYSAIRDGETTFSAALAERNATDAEVVNPETGEIVTAPKRNARTERVKVARPKADRPEPAPAPVQEPEVVDEEQFDAFAMTDEQMETLRGQILQKCRDSVKKQMDARGVNLAPEVLESHAKNAATRLLVLRGAATFESATSEQLLGALHGGNEG
jgi:hypothetical protein